MKNQAEEQYSLPFSFILYRFLAQGTTVVVFHYLSRSIKLIDSHSEINELDLVSGIKESLKEHGFDLSLLLNTESQRVAEILGIEFTCCQHNTYCCNEYCESKTETLQQ
jgi:predicted methyltransferase